MMRTPDWAQALRDDPVLVELAAARAARVPDNACAPSPQCLADAWIWTEADIALVQARLRLMMSDKKRAKALVTRQMRPSGRFARYAALSHADRFATAWSEPAAALNHVTAS